MKKSFLFTLLATLALCHFQSKSNFLIVGMRSRKAKEGYLQSKCIICSKEENMTMKAYSMRNWFTLFFIPVLPYSKKKYFLKCTQCKNYLKPSAEIDMEKLFSLSIKPQDQPNNI